MREVSSDRPPSAESGAAELNDEDGEREAENDVGGENAFDAEPEEAQPQGERADDDQTLTAEEDRDDSAAGDAGGERRDRQTPQRGVSSAEASQMIERATGHVEQLLGVEPDRVSGIERTNGTWSVMVEVVELHRVPESTDVLSSYAVVLDDSGDLIRIERTRRYHRSQVEEG